MTGLQSLLAALLADTSIIISLSIQTVDFLFNMNHHSIIHHVKYTSIQYSLPTIGTDKFLCCIKPSRGNWVNSSLLCHNIYNKQNANYASWSAELIPINDSVCSSSQSEILWMEGENKEQCYKLHVAWNSNLRTTTVFISFKNIYLYNYFSHKFVCSLESHIFQSFSFQLFWNNSISYNIIIISNVDNNTHSSKYWQLDIISGHALHCTYILAISVNRD